MHNSFTAVSHGVMGLSSKCLHAYSKALCVMTLDSLPNVLKPVYTNFAQIDIISVQKKHFFRQMAQNLSRAVLGAFFLKQPLCALTATVSVRCLNFGLSATCRKSLFLSKNFGSGMQNLRLHSTTF